MKWLLLFLCCSACAMAEAQNTRSQFNVSVGAELAFPTGNFTNNYRTGFGGNLKTEYRLTNRFAVTASGGWLRFTGDGQPLLLQLIPLLGGTRFYLGNFYVAAEGGKAFVNQGPEQSGFMYAFSVGDEIIVGNGGNSLDISVRFQNWNSQTRLGFYALRLAYEFRLR